jgi:hypothetical protein
MLLIHLGHTTSSSVFLPTNFVVFSLKKNIGKTLEILDLYRVNWTDFSFWAGGGGGLKIRQIFCYHNF